MGAIIVVILLAGVGVLGDFFIKLSGNGSEYVLYKPFFVGMFLYALTACGWLYAMKHVKLGSLGMFYSLTTVILLILVGAVFFNEKLSTHEIIGIALGIISLIILTKFD